MSPRDIAEGARRFCCEVRGLGGQEHTYPALGNRRLEVLLDLHWGDRLAHLGLFFPREFGVCGALLGSLSLCVLVSIGPSLGARELWDW